MEYLCCGSKKRKKVHQATGPIFKNQLTRTKVFFIPGLTHQFSQPVLACHSDLDKDVPHFVPATVAVLVWQQQAGYYWAWFL